MNPLVIAALKAAAVGALAAFVVDIAAWQRARAANEDAGFDWLLAISRWGMGAITGAASGLGINLLGG